MSESADFAGRELAAVVRDVLATGVSGTVARQALQIGLERYELLSAGSVVIHVTRGHHIYVDGSPKPRGSRWRRLFRRVAGGANLARRASTAS